MPTTTGTDAYGRTINVDIPEQSRLLSAAATGLDVGAVLAAGAATAEPTVIELDGQPAALTAVVPAGYQFLIDTEKLRKVSEYAEQQAEVPVRTTGHVHVRDLASWSAYVLRHGAETTEVFADQSKPAVTALLNAPGRDVTGWGDHRVTLDLEHSTDWLAWRAIDGKYQTQEAFAEHVEAYQPTVVEPDAATLLELAQTFEATKGADFKSGLSLQSGQRQFTYIETIEGKAGQRGQITIPKQLTLQVAPWRGVPVAVQLTARFRYRIEGGNLRLGVILDRVKETLDQAWADFTDDINRSLNGPEADGGADKGYPVLQGPAPVYSGRSA